MWLHPILLLLLLDKALINLRYCTNLPDDQTFRKYVHLEDRVKGSRTSRGVSLLQRCVACNGTTLLVFKNYSEGIAHYITVFLFHSQAPDPLIFLPSTCAFKSYPEWNLSTFGMYSICMFPWTNKSQKLRDRSLGERSRVLVFVLWMQQSYTDRMITKKFRGLTQNAELT